MGLDLSRLGTTTNAPLIEPREIYSALPNKQWSYLRLEQGEVLEKWFNLRTNRDLVIKQNTGGGKTAVGLLIAQSSINEGVGPVAYLASDKYLVRQVVKEAESMGITVTSEPSDPLFISHKAILVVTFKKLVNGMSVFGIEGGKREILELGTIIVDDAHAALASVEDQFSISVSSASGFYEEMIALFSDELKKQSESEFREIREGDSSAILRIPFWAWYDRQSQVITKMMPYLSENEFKFQWPLMRDQFAVAIATLSSTSLDIRLPAPAIHKIPSFTRAKRRIYLTATLADDAVLCQDLDADPALIATAVTPGRASDIGDRIIIAPLELNPDLPRGAIQELARNYADGWPDRNGSPTRPKINVVVLVPSNRAAETWREFADHTFTVETLEEGVSLLKAGHVGLVVLANKYDGIDLAHDACRLLIIDGLPIALDAVERREASALVKSHKVLSRQVQRVEQGMGRGVRDSKDYCAILLLGGALTQVMHDPQRRKMFSRATAAQIEISHQLAGQLIGASTDDIANALDLCVRQNQEWLRKSREALAKTEYESIAYIRPTAIGVREAFNKAIASDFRGAASVLQTRIDACDDTAERGWLMEQQATYTHITSPVEAQRLLLAARNFNHQVLHPIAGVTIERVRTSAAQAREVRNYIVSNYHDSLAFVLDIKLLTESIQWVEESTNDAELAWQKIGMLLGFGSQRPEKEFGTGPDNLWALTNGMYLVTELKTGSQNATIKKSDIDQLGGSVRWFQENYESNDSFMPVMLHPSEFHHLQGTPPENTRIITPACLDKLKNELISLSGAIRSTPEWDSELRIEPELRTRGLTAANFLREYSVPVKAARR